MKIISVVGARPNFVKIGPFIKEIEKHNVHGKESKSLERIDHILVHTGQHYDKTMNKSFFIDLNIPEPDINLGIGSGTHAEQVGKTMIEFEKILRSERPDWVVVVGDVNATLACSITAKKENVKCCHIEAGLRSGDLSMPEEINRLVTDRLSDLLLTPDKLSVNNLLNEGISDKKIRFVGNIMIDTLIDNLDKANTKRISSILLDNRISTEEIIDSFLSENMEYALLTMHRPSNVDNKYILTSIIDLFINEINNKITIIWPIHPRTIKQIKNFNLWDKVINAENMLLLHPVGYHEMLYLNKNAKLILTDSGGLQEESSFLGTPCITLRWNTERPVTLRRNGGTSILVGNDIKKIRKELLNTLNSSIESVKPELWDGKTALRCLSSILEYDSGL